MATLLAPVNAREVLRCDQCGLIQFTPCSGISSPCRRCRIALDYQEPPPPSAPTPQPAPEVSLELRATVKRLRLRIGLSQRQLAGRMSVPRTYVSKIENGKAMPTLRSLERLARALELTVPALLADPERIRQKQVAELLSDRFVAEVAPFLSKLTGPQRREIAATVHAMAVRPRRAMD